MAKRIKKVKTPKIEFSSPLRIIKSIQADAVKSISAKLDKSNGFLSFKERPLRPYGFFVYYLNKEHDNITLSLSKREIDKPHEEALMDESFDFIAELRDLLLGSFLSCESRIDECNEMIDVWMKKLMSELGGTVSLNEGIPVPIFDEIPYVSSHLATTIELSSDDIVVSFEDAGLINFAELPTMARAQLCELIWNKCVSDALVYHTPYEAISALAKDSETDVRYAVANCAKVPSEILNSLATEKNKTIKEGLAQNMNSSSGLLEILSNDKEDLVVSYVANNPNASLETLEKLSSDARSSVRENVAQNKTTPGSILAHLIDNEPSFPRSYFPTRVIYWATRNPNLPSDYLLKSINSSNKVIREAAALNPSIPVENLALLAKDGEPSVRRAVAQNEKTPLGLLSQLSEDTDSSVVFAVAQNPNTPGVVLNEISKNCDVHIRKRISCNHNAPKELLLGFIKDPEMRVEMGENNNLPDEILIELVKAGNSRSALAELIERGTIPMDLLTRIAESGSLEAKERVAESSLLPDQYLQKWLSPETDGALASHAALNPNVPISLLSEWAAASNPSLKIRAASNTRTPNDILALLAKDSDPSVREAVASNTNIGQELFDQLSLDTEKKVVRALSKNINLPLSVCLRFASSFYSDIRSSVVNKLSKGICTSK